MTRKAVRQARLGDMLRQRRREIQEEVRHRIRDGRAAGATTGGDDLDHADAGSQTDLSLALLEMRTETLARIDQALGRLAAGAYGRCIECEGLIAEPRLRALPFAVRCQACEESREEVLKPERASAERSGRSFPEAFTA